MMDGRTGGTQEGTDRKVTRWEECGWTDPHTGLDRQTDMMAFLGQEPSVMGLCHRVTP